jgi:hypothetical protein
MHVAPPECSKAEHYQPEVGPRVDYLGVRDSQYGPAGAKARLKYIHCFMTDFEHEGASWLGVFRPIDEGVSPANVCDDAARYLG